MPGAGQGNWPVLWDPHPHLTVPYCSLVHIWERKKSYTWWSEQQWICLPEGSKQTFSNILNLGVWGRVCALPGMQEFWMCQVYLAAWLYCFVMWQRTLTSLWTEKTTVSAWRSLGIAIGSEKMSSFPCILSSTEILMFSVNLDILCQVLCSLLSPSNVVKFKS